MSATPDTAAPTGRKKPAQGKDPAPAGDTALGHDSQNTPSPKGAKEGGELPIGWKWKTIPNLVTEEGVFIDGDWVESKDQDPDGDVRLIQLADVGDGVYRDKSNRFMTMAKADALGCTFLKEGDVLIARMPDPLGRACIFPGDEKPSVTVVDVAIVRSGNGEFDHRWLACFVNAHPFRSAISSLQAGSTRKRISRGNLATIPLPVPPLPEQRRIVADCGGD
jgi:type I restriction enzyme, S subunit